MTIKKIVHLVLLALVPVLVPTISSAQIKVLGKSIILPEPAEGSVYSDGVELAQNTRSGETLIVWYPTGEEGIVGRIVTGNAVPKPFTIFSKPQKPIDVFNGEVDLQATYNPVTNEYLVVHSEGHEDSTGQFGKIIAMRLDAQGRRKGNPIDLTSRFSELAFFDNKSRVLKFNPINGSYITFSHRHTKPAQSTTIGVYEQLTSKGKPARRPSLLDWITVDGMKWPADELRWPSDFTFLPSGKMLMYAMPSWYDPVRNLTELDYVVANVDPINQNQLKNLRPEDWTVVTRLTSPFLPPLGKEGAVLNLLSPDSPILYFTDNKNAMGQKISTDGKLLGHSFKALNSPGSKKRLFVTGTAFSAASKGVIGLLIAIDDPGWPNGPVSVWAQQLNSKGNPVGPSKKLYQTASNERIDFDKLFALPIAAGDGAARFVWYGLKGDSAGKTGMLKLDISVP